MLLDYASLYREPELTPSPGPGAAWVPPRRRKQREKQVLALGMDAILPGIENHAEARVHSRATANVALLTLVLGATLDAVDLRDGWTDELLILAGAWLLLEDDEDDDD